ncbi:MAG TPA: SDR family NAD(P)-dependent oxidoreductase [Thermoanaerobaculia bacterium]|nr:SDR family NAD(P)-dependent oxidoreductase [Thermoanaerobaculia bacterium]
MPLSKSVNAINLPLILRGKNVVITGASSGIGRATALEFGRRGANLVIAARRGELLDEVARLCREHSVNCTTVVADVSSRNDCKRLIDSAGAIDILVNNAGFAVFDAIENANPDDLEAMIRSNYLGAVWCTQAALPQMLDRGDGTIINVASIAGLMGYARMGGYCATKFAMIGFTEALRDEVIGRGVRVAMVCPGTTETNFFANAERGKMPAASRLILAIKPEKVANAICDSAVDGRYRRILPFMAAIYMRFKEISPRFAHLLMRRVSALLEKG